MLDAIHPECVAATEGAARALESLGHTVEPAWPDALLDAERGERTMPIAIGELRAGLAIHGNDTLGRPFAEPDVEPFTWAMRAPAYPTVTAEEYLEALEWEQAWVARVVRWWRQDHDLLLTPSVGAPPPTLREMEPPPDEPLATVLRVAKQVAFTQPFNLTGQPAISLPLHWTATGLPIGVQLVADIGREDLLLRVAAQLERAQPWADRRPLLHA
jgi:amidase